MTSDVLARKSTDNLCQRALLPSSQRESAAVYSTDSRPCNSPALHHKAFASRTRSTFSGHASQWRHYPTAHAASTVSIVLTVPTAVGFSPKFLLGCCLIFCIQKDLYDQHSHTVSPDHIYLSAANECCCCGLCILQSVSTRSGYFVNHIQFTTPASARLCSASLCGISDGIFDGVKLPHVLSIGRKHILCTACFLCAREECT